jgi:hypothetical protein
MTTSQDSAYGFSLDRKHDFKFRRNIGLLVDAAEATATFDADRVRILNEIDVKAVNQATRGHLASAEEEEVTEKHITGVVTCAAMGDPEPLSLVLVLVLA